MPKALVVLTLSLAVVACMAGDAVAASESRVIVVLEDGAGDPGTVAAEHGRRFGARVSNVYRSALRAYAATVPSDRFARTAGSNSSRPIVTFTRSPRTCPPGSSALKAT
jgi:hypothetical protein